MHDFDDVDKGERSGLLLGELAGEIEDSLVAGGAGYGHEDARVGGVHCWIVVPPRVAAICAGQPMGSMRRLGRGGKAGGREERAEGSRERVLHTMGEALDQDLGEVGEGHLPLGESDVVPDAMSGEGASVSVEKDEGGARIPVAGLADAAGVNNVTSASEVEGIAGTKGPDIGERTTFGEDGIHGDVSMANEANVGVEVGEVVGGDRDAGDVFPDGGAGAAVGEGVVDGDGRSGEIFEVGAVVRVELERGPPGGNLGDGIEVGEVEIADAGEVVVADQEWIGRQRHHEVEAFAGSRTVPHGVADVPDGVDMGSGSEDRLKSDEVCVNVGDNERLH